MPARQPLDAVLGEVARREPGLELQAGTPSGRGWTRADRLLARTAVEELVRTAAAQLVSEHPETRPATARTVATSVLVAHWAWALAVASAGVFAATGQVLDLGPDHVHLRTDRGEVTGIAVERLSDRSGAPALHAELTDHLARLRAVVGSPVQPLLRRSARAWHGGTGDAVVAALLRQSQQVPTADAARLLRLGDDLLAAFPSWGEPGWLVVEDPPARTRRRTTCCLWYRLPEQEPCLTCPRLLEHERRARLLAQDSGLVPS